MLQKTKRRKIKDLMEIDQITERDTIQVRDHLKLITYITEQRDPLNLQPMLSVGTNMSQGQLISFQKTIMMNWSIRIMTIQTLLTKMKINLKSTRKAEADQICIMACLIQLELQAKVSTKTIRTEITEMLAKSNQR